MSDLIKRYGIDRAKRELKAMDDRSIWMISDCIEFREEVRKEIADYDRTDTCVGIGKIDSLHPEFAKVLHDNFLDLITDNCSDIKNHLSPSTEVIER